MVHPITRLIVGGAQENTMLTAQLTNEAYGDRFYASVVSGIQAGPEGSLWDETLKRGVPLASHPDLVREIHPWKDYRAYRGLTESLRGSNGTPPCHIVHTHTSKAGIVGRAAARAAGVPVIIHTVHGWGFHDYTPKPLRSAYVALERKAAKNTHALIAVTPRDIEKGLEEGIGTREQYRLVRSGVELEVFSNPPRGAHEVRKELGIPEQALVVGSVTRLSEQKDPITLARTIIQLTLRHPNLWCVVVGDGPMRKKFEDQLTQAGVRERVVLTGIRRDVPDLVNTFDVFLLTSLWEGLPRVVPQAMAAGRPVVCTSIDGCREIVDDGVNGYLVSPKQVDAIASRVHDLIENSELRTKMGAAGKESAQGFGHKEMVRKIIEVYDEFVD